MRAPATAALLLAALTALPCRGTDADAASKLKNDTRNINERETRPTLNKIYQMLHDKLNLKKSHNNNVNSTLTPNIIIINYDFAQSETEKCCTNATTDSKESDGAEIVLSVKENEKRNRGRRKRGNAAGRKSEGRPEATIAPAVTSQPVSERRRKPEAGSSSPLLNYIFDTYSNTHQHRNERVGNSNSIYAAAAPEAEALVGSTAHLDCKVDALHDKLVSWVRRKSDDAPMDLLTTGTQKYTADDRYSARFIPPDIWRLEIRGVRPSDAAHYDCQLSAHPPRTARLTLRVPEVSVRIVDGAGAEVSEQVCEEGSTVALRCEVRGLRMEGGPTLLWRRRDATLNDDTTRGGISVRTEFGVNGANSVLRVARVRPDDAGQYSCSVARAPAVDLAPAHVILHVIKGESLAELHQGGSACRGPLHPPLAVTTLLVVFYRLNSY